MCHVSYLDICVFGELGLKLDCRLRHLLISRKVQVVVVALCDESCLQVFVDDVQQPAVVFQLVSWQVLLILKWINDSENINLRNGNRLLVICQLPKFPIHFPVRFLRQQTFVIVSDYSHKTLLLAFW